MASSLVVVIITTIWMKSDKSLPGYSWPNGAELWLAYKLNSIRMIKKLRVGRIAEELFQSALAFTFG